MTWRSLTCSSLLPLALAGATVTGQIELIDSRDPGVRKHKDYSGVVVWLEPNGAPAPLPKAGSAVMEQRGKKFRPHVLAIPVGTTVEFPNFDPIFHNAFSNFAGQPFDTGLYAPGTTQKVYFRRPGVVRVFCNIHSTMSAVIVVLRTPYIAISNRAGTFEIDGVPPGDYHLSIWHERAPEKTLKALERRVTVGAEGLKLPPARVSESGYLEIPHKNKYGQEYPPEAPEHVIYPGGKK